MTIAEALLVALNAQGSEFCGGCEAARKVAIGLRDTASERIEAAEREAEGE